jgi:acetolactate synthase I/II/III large subunit
MVEMTVARALATLLERMGTEYVFGVNGHGNWALLDALVHETRIKGVPARAEDHALQMADGYWRARRRAPLPVVLTSVGLGNMNIASPLATAFYESIPMVVLAGSGPTHGFDRGGLEEMYRQAPESFLDARGGPPSRSSETAPSSWAAPSSPRRSSRISRSCGWS